MASRGRQCKPAAVLDDNDVRSGGYCIRCAKEIASNVEKPLCRDCFASWAEYVKNIITRKRNARVIFQGVTTAEGQPDTVGFRGTHS